jgi:hypothetical protein
MKKHVLAGRYGPDDKLPIPINADEQLTNLQLIVGERTLDHGVGAALTSLKALGVRPTEMGIDLAVIAAHIHAADTRISRADESQDSWTREVRLVVPVHDPQCWSAAVPTLTKLLNFLTGDRWMLQFRPRPKRFATIATANAASLLQPPFTALSLFSGGLDSLIGAIDLLEAGEEPLLISHYGEGATSDAQNKLFSGLKQRYPKRPFDRLRVHMVFPDGLVKDVESENSTRGRSFLFIALGAMAGTGLGEAFTLRVPENGLIALNVPLDPLRLGSNSTRTTHPFYLARWNDLFAELGVAGRVKNPYWHQTKGEMAAACASEAALRALAPASLSCAHPASARWQGVQGKGIEHCGYCLPCLIRRAALERAWGKGADETSYIEANLRAHVLDTGQSIGQQVRSFQYAIARLEARPEIAGFLVHKPGSLADVADDVEQWTGVYRRGLGEVGDLIAGVRTGPS